MLPVRTFRFFTRLVMPRLRLAAPLVLTNNYLNLYNLNLTNQKVFQELEEEEDEVK